MAVSESLSAYSTTASSNTPAGTDAVGTELDDHLRDIKRLVRTVGQSSRGIASPDIVPGRFWYDSSGSASAFAVLKIGDGAQDIALFEINESANTTLPYFGSTVAGSAAGGIAGTASCSSARYLRTLGHLALRKALRPLNPRLLVMIRLSHTIYRE